MVLAVPPTTDSPLTVALNPARLSWPLVPAEELPKITFAPVGREALEPSCRVPWRRVGCAGLNYWYRRE